MKPKALILSILFLLSMVAPLWAIKTAPVPRPRPPIDQRLREVIKGIMEALERQQMQRDARVQRMLIMPGCNPVVVPPLPVPAEKDIQPEKLRWVPAEALRPGVLIPKDEE